MKLSIPRKALSAALAAVKSATVNKPSLPILGNVLLKANKASLDLSGTDLDLTIRTRVAATVTAEGTTTVRASLFHDLVRSFAGEIVELELLKENLKITCGGSDGPTGSVFRLGILSPDELPASPKLKDPIEFSMGQAALRSLLAETSFCQSQDPNRAVLNGSFIRVNGVVTVAGCDGRRLATEEGDLTTPTKETADIVIPSKTTTALLGLLDPSVPDAEKENPKQVTVTLTKNVAQFTFGDTIITSKLVEGAYPDYAKVIPKLGHGVPIGRADLLGALRRLNLISDTCALDFRGQTLAIRARGNKEIPGDAVETLLIPKSPEMSIGFNTAYLMQALEAVDSDEIQFFAKDANAPAVLKIAGKTWLCVTAALTKNDPKAAPAPSSSSSSSSSSSKPAAEAPKPEPAKK